MERQKLLLRFRAARSCLADMSAEAGVLDGHSLKREACSFVPVVARSSSSTKDPPFTARSFRARVSSLARC